VGSRSRLYHRRENVCGGNRNAKPVVSFKVDDDLFLQMSDRPGFIPAPYLARAKWVQVIDLSRVSDAELKALIRRSYDLITAKLTRKLRTELGLTESAK